MSVGDRKILSGEPNAMTSVAFGIVIAKTSIPLNAVLLSVWMAQFSFFLPQSWGGGGGGQMQVMRLGDKLLYSLSHLVGPILFFETEFPCILF